MDFQIKGDKVTKIFPRYKRRFLFLPKKEQFKVLDSVSLGVMPEETVGILGANGAGKSTLLKIFSGLLQPTSGKVTIHNQPITAKMEKIIGFMQSTPMIYRRLTGFDNLKYFARLYKVKNSDKRIRELTDFLEITDWLGEYVERYSTGMVVRLDIARALVHDPQVLILDEPFLNLDLRMAAKVKEKIKDLNKTVIISTHAIEDAEILCDRIALLHKGKLVKIDTPHNFKKIIRENIRYIFWVEKFTLDDYRNIRKEHYVKDLQFVQEAGVSAYRLKLTIKSREFFPRIIAKLTPLRIIKISEEEMSLREVISKVLANEHNSR